MGRFIDEPDIRPHTMAVSNQTTATSDDWVEIRDFTKDDSGFEHSKYEVKVLENVEKEYIEDDIVILKETDPRSGHEKLYQFPTEAIERIVDQL